MGDGRCLEGAEVVSMQVIPEYLDHANQDLSFVAYFKAFLGSSFPIHTCPSQMHGSEFLQRGVTDQLLCHSTSVYQDTVTRTVIILGEKLSS